ncbi:MAG: hypothetical protein ACTSP4_01610 [Candidatus Hodarchaeales archaeon]
MIEKLTDLVGSDIVEKKKMNSKTSRRIQSHSDKTGKNQGFKARAMKTATKKRGK